MAAEITLASSIPNKDRFIIRLSGLREAARLFPFDRFIRMQPAYALMANEKYIGPEFILAEVDRVLKRDPYAWDLLHDRQVLIDRVNRGK